MRDFKDQERYCWSLLRDLEPTWVLIHLYKIRGAHEAWRERSVRVRNVNNSPVNILFIIIISKFCLWIHIV